MSDKKINKINNKDIKIIKIKSLENVKKIKENIKQTEYIRPKKTYTDDIQNKESVLNQLKDYIVINNYKLKTGIFIKYITLIKNKPKFRLGGIIIKNTPEYITLKNNNITWSVPKYHKNNKDEIIFETIFYKKCKENKEISNKEKDNIILNLEKEIKYLKNILKK
jgi:hypothetical protein